MKTSDYIGKRCKITTPCMWSAILKAKNKSAFDLNASMEAGSEGVIYNHAHKIPGTEIVAWSSPAILFDKLPTVGGCLIGSEELPEWLEIEGKVAT